MPDDSAQPNEPLAENGAAEEAIVEDDAPTALPPVASADESLPPPTTLRAAEELGDSDARLPAGMEEEEEDEGMDWDELTSARPLVVELKGIEAEIRRLLGDRDPKRKRKLAGTRRWLELEDDVLTLRHTGRIDEATLDEVLRLIRRRHHLFRRLKFLAGTRPTWNT